MAHYDADGEWRESIPLIRIKIKSVQSDVRGGRISETCAGIVVLHQIRFAQLSRL